MDKPAAPRRERSIPKGVEIRQGKTGERLRIAFVWRGHRCRETLNIPATPANIKYADNLLGSVRVSIEKGTFDYAATFPFSKYAKKVAPKEKTRHTVSTLIDDYIGTARTAESLSPSTIDRYVRLAAGRLKPKWGDRYVDEIETPEVRKWISDLCKEISPKTIRNVVSLLSAVLSRAMGDSLISSNPLAPIELKSVLPRKKRKAGEDIDPFNDDEISAILGAFRTVEERALWQFAFATGLRTGELIAIKWGDIDTIWGVIRVKDNVVTGETGPIEKDTKTGNSREIPILPAAQEAIDLMRPISRMAGEFIFLHPRTGKRWYDDQQMRKGSWTPTLLRAGVKYRNPVIDRHYGATDDRRNGASLKR